MAPISRSASDDEAEEADEAGFEGEAGFEAGPGVGLARCRGRRDSGLSTLEIKLRKTFVRLGKIMKFTSSN
jgi:hypothetical protein